MAAKDIECILNLVKEKGSTYLKSEKGKNTRSQANNDNQGTIPPLFLVLLTEVITQITERQEVKDKEMKEYYDNGQKEMKEYYENELKVRDEKITKLEEHNNDLVHQIDNTGQQTRKDNLKIIGLPYDKDENLQEKVKALFDHTGVTLEDKEISVVHRIMTKDDAVDSTNEKIPSVILKFVHRNVKSNAFASRKLIDAKPGCKFPNARIYEDVTPLRSRIMYELRQRKDNEDKKMFRFVWSREGRIYARTEAQASQDPQPKPYIINRAEDLKKLGWNENEVYAIIHNKRA